MKINGKEYIPSSNRTRSTRSFSGTLVTANNYQQLLADEGEEKIKFHKKHLQAYKKGYERFAFGVNPKTLEKIYHKV